MKDRHDFLRHIVNPLLAKYSRERKPLVRVIDEVRKLIALAEDKYGFSSFGGEVTKLADYIESKDFDLVINTLKSVDSLDIVIEVLKTVISKYQDLPKVVEAAKKRIKQLKQSESKPKDSLEQLLPKTVFTEIMKYTKGNIVKYEDRIVIEQDNTKITIRREDNTYRIDVKETIKTTDANKIPNIIKFFLSKNEFNQNRVVNDV